jgi:hypothetical protein
MPGVKSSYGKRHVNPPSPTPEPDDEPEPVAGDPIAEYDAAWARLTSGPQAAKQRPGANGHGFIDRLPRPRYHDWRDPKRVSRLPAASQPSVEDKRKELGIE